MLRPDVRSDAELQRDEAKSRHSHKGGGGGKAATASTVADLFTTRLVILPLLRLENLLPYPIKVRAGWVVACCKVAST